jgi:hypothetical protein
MTDRRGLEGLAQLIACLRFLVHQSQQGIFEVCEWAFLNNTKNNVMKRNIYASTDAVSLAKRLDPNFLGQSLRFSTAGRHLPILSMVTIDIRGSESNPSTGPAIPSSGLVTGECPYSGTATESAGYKARDRRMNARVTNPRLLVLRSWDILILQSIAQDRRDA